MERLHSKCGAAHEERDQAVRERDKAQQRISSLQAELGTAKSQRLEVEGAATGLAMDLA